MMLPGKLCIAIIEEDNPVKAYFRLKPLLVEENGKYRAFDARELFPEDGCIRIVPDKNESSHFKARMRRMGRFCVLDLREHPAENDKIRLNKNYRLDEGERNTHIVYSDVVREPARDMIFQIFDDLLPGAWSGEAPSTPRLLRGDELSTWSYIPAMGDSANASVEPDGGVLSGEELQRFALEGFDGEPLRFAIRLPGSLPGVTDPAAPQPERYISYSSHYESRYTSPADREGGMQAGPYGRPFSPYGRQAAPYGRTLSPYVRSASQPPELMHDARPRAGFANAVPLPPREDAPEAPQAGAPDADAVPPAGPAVPPVAEAPAPAEAGAPEAPPAPAEERAPEAPRAEPKPWISHDPSLVPPAPPRGLSRRPLEGQTGLNPRRSRSLQEIIEEKWRHSREDQLGHPVPANGAGQPVESPLERAMSALRDAWDRRELRQQLLESITQMSEFSEAMAAVVRRERDGALRKDLEELEAERLRSLNELDQLQRRKQELRESLKREIRAEEEENNRELAERTRAAQEECARQEAAAQAAKEKAAIAEGMLAELEDGRFDEKLRDYALASRAARLLQEPTPPAAPAEVVSDEAPTAAEWIGRTQRAFAAEGLEIDAVHAANLLICASLSDLLLFSGPASADKDRVAHALARALGALRPGGFRELSVGDDAEALKRPSELPRVALIHGANSRARAALDGGLSGASENLLIFSTLSDSGSGYPLSPEALEHGFLIRLEPVGAQTPWRPAAQRREEFSPVRMESLRAAFLVDDREELPAGLERRLQRLRDALAEYGVRLSRHTLDLMWRYCAAMIRLNKISAGEALDLAFAQKALPCILAEAPMECLIRLRQLLSGMPHCLSLLNQPLPIRI